MKQFKIKDGLYVDYNVCEDILTITKFPDHSTKIIIQEDL